MNPLHPENNESNQEQLLASLTKSRQEKILHLNQLEPLQGVQSAEATVWDQAPQSLSTGLVTVEFHAGHPVSGRYWPTDKGSLDLVIERGMFLSYDWPRVLVLEDVAAFGDEVKFFVTRVTSFKEEFSGGDT